MLSTTLSSTVISSGSERRSLSDFLKVVSPIRKVDKPRLFWVQSIFLDPVIALHSSSPKMALLTRRPLELCALFLSLTVFAVSAGNSGSRSRPSRSSNLNFNGARPLDSIEARMLQQARDSHIRPIFQRARAQWYSYTSALHCVLILASLTSSCEHSKCQYSRSHVCWRKGSSEHRKAFQEPQSLALTE